MAKKKRRGVSFGTVLVLLITVATVGGCLWLLTRFAGGLDALTQETSALVHVITGEQAWADGGVERAAPSLEAEDSAFATPAPIHPDPTPVPTPRTMTVRAVGSIYGTKNIQNAALDAETGVYQFREFFTPVQPLLSAADLTLATLETTLAGAETGYGDYNTPSQMLDALQYAGIDLLSLATERSLEHGALGLRETMLAAEGKGFLTVGAAREGQVPPQPKVFLVNDIQVTVLAYTYGLSKNAQSRTDKADQGMVAQMDEGLMRAQIAEARKQGANLIIVMMHWGTKNQTKLSDQQKQLGAALCDMGADVVIGTHPNVPQSLDIRTSETGNRTLIAYSLGSFLSDDRDINNASSIVLGFTATLDLVTKQVELSEITYTPIWVERTRREGGGYHYSILRAADEATRESRAGAEQRGMENACRVVTKAVDPEVWQILP